MLYTYIHILVTKYATYLHTHAGNKICHSGLPGNSLGNLL